MVTCKFSGPWFAKVGWKFFSKKLLVWANTSYTFYYRVVDIKKINIKSMYIKYASIWS